MRDIVKEVAVRYFEKLGNEGLSRFIPLKETRLSVYFDYQEDNYHIQFGSDTDRKVIANQLMQLAGMILSGSKHEGR